MGIQGYKANNNKGHGLYINFAFDVEVRNVTVYNFPEDNFHVNDGWHVYVFDCYSANGGDSCYYFNSEQCKLARSSSDGAPYSLEMGNTSVSLQLSVTDCHFEGATTAGILLGGTPITGYQTTLSWSASMALLTPVPERLHHSTVLLMETL